MKAPRRKTTEELLALLHSSVLVKLSDICEQYDGTKAYQARVRANRNALPFPAFRLNPNNHRSPWMVRVQDLAVFIDACADEAQASWNKSQ